MAQADTSSPDDIGAIPRATYRLQFNAGFTFADAESIVPYLARLGISHVYASPFLRARTGSTHGYDITDHNALNPEIGDEQAFRSFVETLHRHGMGLIIDFVPNHMGIGKGDNAWWLDVLTWGEASPYARFFDIDWRPAKAALNGKVLVPFLGDHYGVVLEEGQLALAFNGDEGSFHVAYHDHVFPIGPRHYARILVASLKDWPQDDTATIERMTAFARDFRELGAGRARTRNRAAMRDRADTLMRDLARSVSADRALGRFIDGCLAYFNGRPGDAASFMALHRLLQRQNYRLAYWRVAADEINYRRFFDINDLAGLRVEDPNVFDHLHRRVREWIADGTVQGLRIDHIDGLFDPADYCRQLRGLVPERPLYIIVEKILGADEALRADWPIDGTTGYEVANQINACFVDGESRRTVLDSYRSLTGMTDDFEEELHAAKLQVMDTLIASELQVLADELDRIAESNWRTRDFTRNDMVRVLTGVLIALPVYRTYVNTRGAGPDDRRIIEATIRAGRAANPNIDPSLFDFLQSVWTTDLVRRPRPGYSRRQVVRCAMKLQQFTGPLMAKAMEDTAFYRYVPLVSLNDVGGDPDQFGTTIEAFHAANARRLRDWPDNMIATTTHDSKRSEDVRARINAIAELPDEWTAAVSRWTRLNARHRTNLKDGPAPSPRDEYLLYQILVGAWPATDVIRPEPAVALPDDFVSRIRSYMTKALREAKQKSSWMRPDEDYENAVSRFVDEILENERAGDFLDDCRPFAAKLSRLGMLNGLGQTALKLTLPGVPDFYQGSELWDLRLVDPDNRGPVDFSARAEALGALPDGGAIPSSMARWVDGSVKLALITRLLHHRREHAMLYRRGDYVPLVVRGPAADRLCGFARVRDDDCLVVCVARLMGAAPLRDGLEPPFYASDFWAGTEMDLPVAPAVTDFTDLMSGRTLSAGTRDRRSTLGAADMLADFPVAVLCTASREDSDG